MMESACSDASIWVYVYLGDFFFFQAEDGIRDDLVTGVQTCALPIYLRAGRQCRLDGGVIGVRHGRLPRGIRDARRQDHQIPGSGLAVRAEERAAADAGARRQRVERRDLEDRRSHSGVRRHPGRGVGAEGGGGVGGARGGGAQGGRREGGGRAEAWAGGVGFFISLDPRPAAGRGVRGGGGRLAFLVRWLRRPLPPVLFGCLWARRARV